MAQSTLRAQKDVQTFDLLSGHKIPAIGLCRNMEIRLRTPLPMLLLRDCSLHIVALHDMLYYHPHAGYRHIDTAWEYGVQIE
ncbi:aldose reductase, partial [Tanacetum coccineum]